MYMKARNRTHVNKCVRLNNNLLHHISTKQSAVNNDKGSMRTTGLLIRGDVLSTNWLGFEKGQLNDWQ